MTDKNEGTQGRASDRQQIEATENASHQRDVTKALAIVKQMRDDEAARNGSNYATLVNLLETIDARTGRRDPSKRANKQLAGVSSKSATALDVAHKLNGLTFGSPDWMKLITDLITILNDLHVIPTQQTNAQTPQA